MRHDDSISSLHSRQETTQKVWEERRWDEDVMEQATFLEMSEVSQVGE
jgi:hypothetical protein